MSISVPSGRLPNISLEMLGPRERPRSPADAAGHGSATINPITARTTTPIRILVHRLSARALRRRSPGPLRVERSEALRAPVRDLAVTSVEASIMISSTPAMSAKSCTACGSTAVDRQVWCGPPASSQDAAAVAKSGRGCQIARATGSLGNGASGSVRSTRLATSRSRVPRSARPTTSPGPVAAVKTSP